MGILSRLYISNKSSLQEEEEKQEGKGIINTHKKYDIYSLA